MTTPSPQDALREFVTARVEPWMDVLLVGLSPELVAESGGPSRLVTLRLGTSVPSEPWDVVLLRHDASRPALVTRTLARVWSDLRHGGLLAVVAAAEDDPEALDASLGVLEGAETRRLRLEGHGPVVETRKLAEGARDRVGIRRHLQRLRAHVPELERLTLDVRERAASRPGDATGGSLKELVGYLGDRDRDGYLAAVRSLLAETAAPTFDAEDLRQRRDHNGRLLAELVTRFRHFRHQSLAVLEGLGPEDWHRSGPGPDGDLDTLAGHLRRWVREEDELFALLERRCRPG